MENIERLILRTYLLGTIPPALFSVATSLILCILNYDRDYRSEWLTPDFIFQIVMMSSVTIAFLFGVSCLTIFFNRREKIRNNIALCALTWFIIPAIVPVSLLCDDPDTAVLINTVPYLVMLVLSFWWFRKKYVQVSARRPLEIITKENRKTSSGINSDGMPAGGDMAS